MNVLIAGGTGFVGRQLVRALAKRGDHVTVLSRNPSRARAALPLGVKCVGWDLVGGNGEWTEEVSRADAVVNLAGEPVAQRWSPAARARIETTRVGSTRRLVEAIGKASPRPRVFACASAVGYYGPRAPSDAAVDEAAPPGEGFLAVVVERWEAAARMAEGLGVRTAELRIGVVLGEGGGALEKMILPFKFFAGGPIGDGRQVVSWVHRDDVVGLALLALDDDRASGPINAVAPNPVTSSDLAKAIGAVIGRPAALRVPRFAVRLAMGEAAEIVTEGQRVVPARALELRYAFRYAEILPALESILKR